MHLAKRHPNAQIAAHRVIATGLGAAVRCDVWTYWTAGFTDSRTLGLTDGISLTSGPRADSAAAAAPLVAAPDLAKLAPVENIRRRWPIFLGSVLTLLMIAALGRELFGSGLAGLRQHIPGNPLFYLAFALYYLAQPTFEYVIFRRLWHIPIEGLGALHKKRISNEVLFGYSGEAFFYAWARQRPDLVDAPFGAVKDVTILSAIAGNSVTLLLILLVVPFAPELPPAITPQAIAASALLMVAMSVPFLFFSRRVFTLPRPVLWWVFAVHVARVVTIALLAAIAWHLAMPEVAIGTRLFIASARMFSSRLPLVPNKELVFASFAIVLIGSGHAVSELLALFAALALLAHVAMIAGFSLHALLRKRG